MASADSSPLRRPANPVIEGLKAKVMSSPKVVHSKYVPSQLERHLEFINFNQDSHMILGCSNLVGRYWIGSLWYYRDPEEAPSVEKALTGVDFDDGLVDGIFIGDNSNNILVAGDNGGVEHVMLSFNDGTETESEPFYFLDRLKSVQEHDDIITGMTLTCDKSTIVTSSYDRSIVVLDTKTLRLEARMKNAHDDLVTNVATNKVAPNVVATSANDGLVSTWDIRTMASTNSSLGHVLQDMDCRPTCVEWTPNSENHLLVGNQSGDVMLFDARKPKECVCKVTCVPGKQVTRMRFAPGNKSTTFAVCCEAFQVKVFQLDQDFSVIKQSYEDSRHDDFVRDVAWHPSNSSKFYSCGWDHRFYSHNLP